MKIKFYNSNLMNLTLKLLEREREKEYKVDLFDQN